MWAGGLSEASGAGMVFNQDEVRRLAFFCLLATLPNNLDNVIGLLECEAFLYMPEINADPHTSGFSDDEDDTALVAYEASSSAEDSRTPSNASSTRTLARCR